MLDCFDGDYPDPLCVNTAEDSLSLPCVAAAMQTVLYCNALSHIFTQKSAGIVETGMTSHDSTSLEDGSCLDPSTDIQIGGTVLLACSSNKCNKEEGGNAPQARFGRLSSDDVLALLFLVSGTKADRTIFLSSASLQSPEPRTKSDVNLLEALLLQTCQILLAN